MKRLISKMRLAVVLSHFALAVAIAIPAQMSNVGAASAQGRVAIVRDAEIEALVREYARPILNAAGLSKSGIEIVLVNDPSFNAFVAGRRMFINTGALMTAETPNEIIGVLAHEAGHIAGGHQERLRQQLARAQTMAVVASLLGIGATVAGAALDSKGVAQAGTGLAMGGAEVARRSLLSYQRTEETTADIAALQYLDATGQSAKGMLKTFQRFASALALTGANVDPYQISHPMPRERIANLTVSAEKSPNFNKQDSAALKLRHDLMRAKIAAFTGGQGATSRMFRGNASPLPGQYGDAITTYLYGNPATALKKVDALLKVQPANPYFMELRADVLMKANKPRDAAIVYAKAVKLDPSKSGILQIGYGKALLAAGDKASVEAAVLALRKGIDRDRENADAYMPLSQAYGQLGDIGEAELAAAEGHYYSGSYLDAKVFAARAQQKLKRGSPGWVRAQDIINYKDNSKRRK
jgi:predicted Zn-dependent protease